MSYKPWKIIENVKCYKQVEQVAFPYSPKELIDQ